MNTIRLIVECIGWLVCFGGGLALASWFAVRSVEYVMVNMPTIQVGIAWAGSVFGKAFGTAYLLASRQWTGKPPGPPADDTKGGSRYVNYVPGWARDKNGDWRDEDDKFPGAGGISPEGSESPAAKPSPWTTTIDPDSPAVRGGAETAEFKP